MDTIINYWRQRQRGNELAILHEYAETKRKIGFTLLNVNGIGDLSWSMTPIVTIIYLSSIIEDLKPIFVQYLFRYIIFLIIKRHFVHSQNNKHSQASFHWSQGPTQVNGALNGLIWETAVWTALKNELVLLQNIHI